MRLFNKLKEDRNDLENQLDEEKRKNEDLQFKFEEADLAKSDAEVFKRSYLIYLVIVIDKNID